MTQLAAQTTAPRPTNVHGEEFGVPGDMPFGGWDSHAIIGGVAETQAVSKALVPITSLVEMRQRDGHARALLRLFTLPVRSMLADAKWVQPEGGNADREVKFANNMFFLPREVGGMTMPFTKFMRQVLLAVLEGFSAFEEVRDVAEFGPNKGKIVLKKMAHRGSSTIRFLVDDRGGFNGMRQIATSPDGKAVDQKFERDKCWYYAANEEENNFYGVSYFEAAHTHYEIKKRLYYIAHIASQFAAVPGRIGTYPAQAHPDQLTEFTEALKNFAFNTSMKKPEGWTVDLVNMNSNFNFLALIDHHNLMMSQSVLAPWFDDTKHQVLIDNSSQDASADFFVMSMESMVQEIAENLTLYFLPKYIDWNFASGKYPVFKFGVMSSATRDTIKELFLAVSTAQSSKWTDEFIRALEKKIDARLGTEVDYEAVKEREEEAARQQELLQAQFMQQQGGGGSPAGGGGGQGSAAPDQGAPEDQAPPEGGPNADYSYGLSEDADGVEFIRLSKVIEELNDLYARLP